MHWLVARLVKILERPAGQQFAPFPRPLESAIAVGYVFQFNQIQGRLRLTDAKRPGALVLSPFVFLDTTGEPSVDTSNSKRPGAPVLSSFVFLDTTRKHHLARYRTVLR